MPTTTPTVWQGVAQVNTTDAGPAGDDQTLPQVIAAAPTKEFDASWGNPE